MSPVPKPDAVLPITVTEAAIVWDVLELYLGSALGPRPNHERLLRKVAEFVTEESRPVGR